MSTNVIKWSTQSNQRTVAFGSCVSVWVSLTLVCTNPWDMSATRWNKRQFLSACATSVFFIDKYWQMCTSESLQYKSSAVLSYTSPSFTLFALTYFSFAGSCWPSGSLSSWCQLWASLAGKPTASHWALGCSLHRPKFDVFDIYLLILCTSRTTMTLTPLFAPAGNPLCTHALLSPIKYNSY